MNQSGFLVWQYATFSAYLCYNWTEHPSSPRKWPSSFPEDSQKSPEFWREKYCSRLLLEYHEAIEQNRSLKKLTNKFKARAKKAVKLRQEERRDLSATVKYLNEQNAKSEEQLKMSKELEVNLKEQLEWSRRHVENLTGQLVITMEENEEEVEELQQLLERSNKQLAETTKQLEINTICRICMDRENNRVFNCGHVICDDCARTMEVCPKCKRCISGKKLLFLG